MSKIDPLIIESLDRTSITKHKLKETLSPSAFPMCSLVWFTKLYHQVNHGAFENKAKVLLNIFAEAGKGMHSYLQYSLGFTGRLYGHYYCSDYKCAGYVNTQNGMFRPKDGDPKVHWWTKDNICPHCKKGMQYLEVQIIDGDLQMQIDCILLNDDGVTYSVYDFKSTSVDKVAKGTSFNKMNMFQIETYVIEVIEHLEIKVTHYGLTYVARDNPNKFVTYEFKVTKDILEKAESFLARQYKGWRIAKKSVKEFKFKRLYATKLCSSFNEYKKEYKGYEDCPMAFVCFDEQATKDFLGKFMALSDKNKTKSWFELMDTMSRSKARHSTI